ncbi:tRNA 2-thiouridine(34) synthase MnmA [Desulfocurvus sp.]|jgi:tRNA-specific 2-thiouridylase|uniref:tRNA 2-thiouridine(34) synthase MnmA n=1 Tax=Desulfocurvus sp. TaxID=2871698 RepID=UPI0025C1A59A|nr:tRNA 2-thiouridine(34) synthase MnmA [Desulfocurvus sp.]MCK9239711.1 tRNA 2-thiouridine(34) synthase MnmA [Desulfocurvus sp.]
MTIAVAVSGGTDSTFALALLREAGERVLAVHGHFLPPDPARREAARALAATCRALGVPLHEVDLTDAFRRLVVDPFARDHAAGLTPNPCARCNPAMKFGLLLDAARRHGAEALATGHYARLEGRGAAMRLLRGADPGKDQSYFLALVPRERLALAVLPLGSWTKERVRAGLAARGLAPAQGAESQDICFIPGDDHCAFLPGAAARAGVGLPGPGPIRLPDGTRVGRHQGLWRYTLGQRRGIGVAHSEPLYVVAKDMAANTLVVGPRPLLEARGCATRGANLLVPPQEWPAALAAQTRYRQRAKPVRVEHGAQGLTLTFLAPQSLPAPGQVAVVYGPDDAVLAGGVIA